MSGDKNIVTLEAADYAALLKKHFRKYRKLTFVPPLLHTLTGFCTYVCKLG